MSIYKQAGSSIWSTRFAFRGEPIRRSTGHHDRQKAQRFEDELKAELWKRPEALKGKTWGNAVLKWAKEAERSDSDLQSLAKFGAYFKDRLLVEITPDSVDKALSEFCETPSTYVRYRTRIAAILALSGMEIKLLTRKIRPSKPRDWLTHEQWEKLRMELPPHMRAMATFAITTGLRQANVLGLRWDHVNLEGRRLWVDAVEAKGGVAIGIPLSTEAVNVLKSVQGQHPEFCFTYRGRPVSEIKTAFIAACVRAGVGRHINGKYTGFTWHGFRHTFATWHFQAGTPDAIIQQLGAWKSASMLDKYRHHAVAHLASYVDNTAKS